MAQQYQQYQTLLDQITDHSKAVFREKLICHSINEEAGGISCLHLQFNFFGDQPAVEFPAFDENGLMEIFETGHTVLNVHVNSEGVARFFYRGYMDEEGLYVDAAYIDPDDLLFKDDNLLDSIRESSEEDCFTLRLSEPEEVVEVIQYINLCSNKFFKVNQKYEFKDLETSSVLDTVFLHIPSLSDKLLNYRKAMIAFSLPDFQRSVQEKHLLLQVGLEGLSDFRAADTLAHDSQKLDSQLEKATEQFLFLIGDSTDVPKPGDILFHGKPNISEVSGFFTERREKITAGADGYKEYNHSVPAIPSVYVVFRLKKDTSYLAFLHFLQTTAEGEQFLKAFAEQRKWPSKIRFLEDRQQSIQHAIAAKRIVNVFL